jgi:hypothetical protein
MRGYIVQRKMLGNIYRHSQQDEQIARLLNVRLKSLAYMSHKRQDCQIGLVSYNDVVKYSSRFIT